MVDEQNIEATNPQQEKKTYPTETIELPSKGLLYPAGSALKSGKIEIKYPTAKEEDILTNQNLIQNGTVIDKFLKELIVSPIDYNELTIGDKNALMIAARILAYGAEYETEVTCPNCMKKIETTFDLNLLTAKEVDLDGSEIGDSALFEYELPHSERVLTFKALTVKDEKKIDEELKFQKKVHKKASLEMTTRLKHVIVAVDGNDDRKHVRNFVENEFLSRDAYAFRNHMATIIPDVNMKYPFECEECGHDTAITVPMTVKFFWPNAGV